MMAAPLLPQAHSSPTAVTPVQPYTFVDHATKPQVEFDIRLPADDPVEKKLAWLRSQIITQETEFATPFGRRRLTYADHTATGRSLHYIENYIVRTVLPFYGNTHTTDSYAGRKTTEMVGDARRYIKHCLGGGADDKILFCGSGSTAAIKRLQEVMGIAVSPRMRERVLKCLCPNERWIVFIGPYEHHSNLLSWRQSLAEVIEIGLTGDGEIDIQELRVKLESFKNADRPILGSFSACSNVTGISSDTRKIATVLHEYGGFACFDFAASGPYQDIKMKSGEMDGYDAIFLSPHKFLGGPGTPGILMMNKTLYLLGSLPPSTCGGGTVTYVNGFDEKETLYIDDIEERENAGTPPIIQIIRSALTFWVKEFIGHDVIMKREELFIEKALERVSKNQLVWVLGNTTGKRQSILSFMIRSTSKLDNGKESLWVETGTTVEKPLHGAFVAVLLNDLFGIQARGGCACAGPYGHHLLGVNHEQSMAIRSAIDKGYNGVKPGWTRVSFPYFMSIEEFEFILAAIEFISRRGQQFLQLYNINLKTGSWTVKDAAAWGLVSDNNGSLATMMKKMELETARTKHNALEDRFKTYLEFAKNIADKLPKNLNPQMFQFRT